MSRGQDLKPRKMRSDKKSPLELVECKECRHLYYRRNLSKAGLCVNCGYNRLVQCLVQLKNKRGPVYEKWLAGIEASKANMKGGNHGQEND